jgi:hypothetical protein
MVYDPMLVLLKTHELCERSDLEFTFHAPMAGILRLARSSGQEGDRIVTTPRDLCSFALID